MEDNKDYPELEYVILDYHSKDGVEVWLKEEMPAYIVVGKIIYYKIFEPVLAWLGRLKNTVTKLATGDIICHLDPGDYTGPGFAAYINNVFKKDEKIVLTSQFPFPSDGKSAYPENFSGRLCLTKLNFLKLRGYDERIDQAEFIDRDLINRLKMDNIQQISIQEPEFLISIPRKSVSTHNYLYEAFLNYITPTQSELILLYEDGHYKTGAIINSSVSGSADYRNAYRKKTAAPLYNISSGWEDGLWQETKNDSILFTPGHREEYIFLRGHYPYNILFDVYRDSLFLSVHDNEVINKLFVRDHFFYSGSIAEQNLDKKQIAADSYSITHLNVFKNFNWDSPIRV